MCHPAAGECQYTMPWNGKYRWRLHSSDAAGRGPEFRFVPQMNARLVADLDLGIESREDLLAALDDGVLRLPGEVGSVEVDQVVVGDP